MSMLNQTVVYAVESGKQGSDKATVYKMIDYGDYVMAQYVADFADTFAAREYCQIKNASERVDVR